MRAVESSELRDGVWTVVLTTPAHTGNDAPFAAEIWHDGRILPGLAVTEVAGKVTTRFRLPPGILSQGVQVLVLTDAAGRDLSRLVLIAGQPAEDDLRGEIALLRAELDLLKQAFRDHCRSGGG